MKLAKQHRFSWVRQKQKTWHDKWDHYWDSVADIRVDTGQWNFDVLADDSLRERPGVPLIAGSQEDNTECSPFKE